MAGKITSFFKRIPSAKRSLSDNPMSKETSPVKESPETSDENEMNLMNTSQTPNKRKRTESGDVMLSPEQKDRMNTNKTRAKLLLMSKKLEIISGSIGISWFQALEEEFNKPYFTELNSFVSVQRGRGTVFPSREDVWSWTTRTSIQDIRVVILGQDPYHGPGQAHGLCFSVKPGVKTPPSLVNMYKELKEDIPGFSHPGHGHLAGWADQGVLLLNAVLTVTSGNPNSHKDQGWERITDAVIKWISDNSEGVVFLLWGSYAQKKGAYVNGNKHHILKATHPSPLSAHRGFLGSKHFSQCNELLVKSGKKAIDWNSLPR